MCLCGFERLNFRNGTAKSSINTGRYTVDYLLCGDLPYPAWKKRVSAQDLRNRRIRRYFVCRLKRSEARDFSHVRFTNVAVYGYDTIMALFGGAVFAQGGAALAVAIKSKDATFKSQALSASFTALLGITEPAMFGVNLRLKRPMICACIAGAIGSAVAGFFGCRAVSFALPALTTLSLFMGHAFVPFLASLAVSFGLAFLFTMAVTIPDLQ